MSMRALIAYQSAPAGSAAQRAALQELDAHAWRTDDRPPIEYQVSSMSKCHVEVCCVLLQKRSCWQRGAAGGATRALMTARISNIRRASALDLLFF